MADPDEASTEPTPGKVLTPVPATRPARQSRPQGWHSMWRRRRPARRYGRKQARGKARMKEGLACSRLPISGEWRGHYVVDAEGRKIGQLEAIYVDTSTDQPAFATVTVGMPTRHRLTFVPLNQATVGPGYVRVGFDKKLVKDAPSIDTDGELPAGDEEAIFRHYGLTYQAGAGGERRLARR
jgi:hypothetical protein